MHKRCMYGAKASIFGQGRGPKINPPGEILLPKDSLMVQTKMRWRILLNIWCSRQRLGIKVQSCPVL